MNQFNEYIQPSFILRDDGAVLFANGAAENNLGIRAGATISQELATRFTKAFSTDRVDYVRLSQETNLCSIPLYPPYPSAELRLLIGTPTIIESQSHYGVGNSQTQLLSNVAHDLKNPLGAIFGYVDALLDTEMGNNLSTKQREILDKIRLTSFRCIEQVKNYQYLSIQNLRETLSKTQKCNLNDLVNAVVGYSVRDTLEYDPPQFKLNLVLHSAPIILPFNSAHIERIVGNLVSNAVRYTPRGGAITIETKLSGSNALFMINNSGNPIPPNELSELFGKFARASTGDAISGTGLGLYVVNTILDALGGTIRVSSNVNNGTTFRVMLPTVV